MTLPWTSIRAVINQNTSSNCKTSPVNKNTKFLPYIICLLFFKQVLLLLVSISSPEIVPLPSEWLKENLGFQLFSMSRTWFKCPGKISSKTEFWKTLRFPEDLALVSRQDLIQNSSEKHRDFLNCSLFSPDKFSVMTYLAQFYHKFTEQDPDSGFSSQVDLTISYHQKDLDLCVLNSEFCFPFSVVSSQIKCIRSLESLHLLCILSSVCHCSALVT